MTLRPEHPPEGDPCSRCGLPAKRHHPRQRYRPEHTPTADPCPTCHLPASQHKPRGRSRYEPGRWVHKRKDSLDELVIAVDGEGQGRGPHLYTYLAAVDEHGTSYDAVENPVGLSTRECLDFLIDLPGTKRFGYAFVYDLTKILGKDLPDTKLFELAHEETRQVFLPKSKRIVFKPIYWADYKLNFLNRKLTIQRTEPFPSGKPGRRGVGKVVAIWDVFRFFASKFTDALIDWKVASAERLTWMGSMKDKRSSFDRLDWAEVKRYCQEECMYLATLVRKLIEAHRDAGLRLKSFYGAGSTGGALLDKMGIREFLKPAPEPMQHAVACAFFGGRFEISRRGPVPGPVHGYDLSSAYPYQLTGLPCLTHGRWERVTEKRLLRGRVERARLAVVHCRPRETDGVWGPLPWRSPQGTILFPLASDGVWAWRDEALMAARHWRVILDEAWVYDTACDCRPFAELSTIYVERLRIGKEGPGHIFKLGPNSCYGKLAQSKGQPKYQSWILAGNITSGCRAQLLEAMAIAIAKGSGWDVLMLATDGIWCRRALELPAPRDTGTSDAVDEHGKPANKPLGGWEHKVDERGIFLVRPGIYFPRSPSSLDLAKRKIKARGVSTRVLLEHADRIEAWWKRSGRYDGSKYTFKDHLKKGEQGLVRFVGMKSGLLRPDPDAPAYRRTDDEGRSLLGEWVDLPLELSLDARPKRQAAAGDRLLPWTRVHGESMAYDPAVVSPEGQVLRDAERDAEEQPDGAVVEL